MDELGRAEWAHPIVSHSFPVSYDKLPELVFVSVAIGLNFCVGVEFTGGRS